jgi:hypothetical protein
VMTFGLAPVFLLLSGVLLLVQRRIRLAWTLLPACAVFALWYLIEAPRVSGQPHTLADLLLVPLYWLLGIGNAAASVIPWRSPAATILPGLDSTSAFLALVSVCVLVAALVLVARRPRLRPGPVVTVFLLGSPVVIVVTSLSRVSYGLGYAMLSRYTYIGTAFLLPFLLVLLTRTAAGSRTKQRITLAAVCVVVGANIIAWPAVAREWTTSTRDSARTLAAGQQLARAGQPLYREMAATPEFGFLAPDDLPGLDLRQVADEVTRVDQLSAVLSAQVRMVAGETPPAPCEEVASLRLPLASAPFTIRVPQTSTVALSLTDGEGATSRVRATRLTPGVYVVSSLVDDGTLVIRELEGRTNLALCAP